MIAVFTMPVAEIDSQLELALDVRENEVDVRFDRKDPADTGRTRVNPQVRLPVRSLGQVAAPVAASPTDPNDFDESL